MTGEFQSTLPRRERRDGLSYRMTATQISIHAPAKGATLDGVTAALRFCISIHAPAKGATVWATFAVREKTISIHAPAKGATLHIVPLHD